MEVHLVVQAVVVQKGNAKEWHPRSVIGPSDTRHSLPANFINISAAISWKNIGPMRFY